ALPGAAAPFAWLHPFAAAAGAVALPLAMRRARAVGDARLLGILCCVAAGVLANAAVLGALSGPHDRYGARIAWLLPLAGLLAWRRSRRPSAGVGPAALPAGTAAP
ncbi:MAG: hypothetical protein ICV73_12760, partial [Acetobacteraceae bacterium]|nr:hypothetical protein [Acetobacteraceae bacterium]